MRLCHLESVGFHLLNWSQVKRLHFGQEQAEATSRTLLRKLQKSFATFEGGGFITT